MQAGVASEEFPLGSMAEGRRRASVPRPPSPLSPSFFEGARELPATVEAAAQGQAQGQEQEASGAAAETPREGREARRARRGIAREVAEQEVLALLEWRDRAARRAAAVGGRAAAAAEFQRVCRQAARGNVAAAQADGRSSDVGVIGRPASGSASGVVPGGGAANESGALAGGACVCTKGHAAWPECATRVRGLRGSAAAGPSGTERRGGRLYVALASSSIGGGAGGADGQWGRGEEAAQCS